MREQWSKLARRGSFRRPLATGADIEEDRATQSHAAQHIGKGVVAHLRLPALRSSALDNRSSRQFMWREARTREQVLTTPSQASHCDPLQHPRYEPDRLPRMRNLRR